jgi:hypothetical protein
MTPAVQPAMSETKNLKLFASHCRGLAVGAATLAARDGYLDMALLYDCEAEGAPDGDGTDPANQPHQLSR